MEAVSIERLEQKVRILMRSVDVIKESIISHEFDLAALQADDLSRELGIANYIANRIADNE